MDLGATSRRPRPPATHAAGVFALPTDEGTDLMNMVCVEEDDRPSDLPDEGERSSGVTTVPTAAACGHPCAVEHQRRDLCKSCYRKLDEADALPPRRTGHRDRRHPLQRWVGTLDNATLLLLRGWIEEMKR